MNKKFFVIILLIVSFSCETRFESDTRVLVKGKVVNHLGEPIPDAEINVYTRRRNGFAFSTGYSSDDAYVLGKNYSNSNGDFSVTSVFDADEDFSIEVLAGSDYTSYNYYTSTFDYIPTNLIFNLETVELKKTGTVNYNISRVSGPGNTLQYTFRFKNRYCNEFYEKGMLSEDYCYQDEYLSKSLNDNSPNIESSFSTTVGSTVEFVYSINEQPEITETFILNDPTYAFTFTY